MAIKLVTDFWSDEKFEFDKFLLMKGKRCNKEYITTYQVVKEIDLTLSNFYIAQKFRELSKFIVSKEVLRTNLNGDDTTWYQFGVKYEGKLTPIKWFTLIINDNIQLHNDIAFDTPLIKKNSIQLPFGKFSMHRTYKVSKHNEYKMKRNIYKYIANQIAKA